MRSEIPKPLHRLCGRPMVLHVLDALAELPIARVVVVVGYRAIEVTKTLDAEAPSDLRLEYVEQVQQLGTGDAAAVALTGFPPELDLDDGDVVILPGDTPLVRPATLAALVRLHRETNAAATLLTARVEDPTGYGRVVRAKDGSVARIVEEADATDEEAEINEVATSMYCFRYSVLAPTLRRLSPNNAQGEYYLTDTVEVLHDAGYTVTALVVPDPVEAAGVNDRAQLAAAEAELRDRINDRHMRYGVTMTDPSTTYVGVSVTIEEDVTLAPGIILDGATAIGRGASIGAATHLTDTVVGPGARLEAVVADGASIGEAAVVGPFVTLARGAHVDAYARVVGQGAGTRDDA
jgi:bifunctional UDP-N-acetylglucosamine pyrophosphorylase / glucosamine-1-phosphate N-acetyltransferase